MMLASGAFAGQPAPDGGAPPPTVAGWMTWHTDHFFTSCQGNCALSAFGGWQVRTRMADIFVNDPSPPWDWRWGNSQLVGAALSRRLLTLWHALDIEPELGIAQRFGDMHAQEGWLALYFRWTRFPWNRTLRTSIATSIGLSFAANLPARARNAQVLNYFSPELTFALPAHPRYELLVQFHHRSDLWVGHAFDPGWQYLTLGVRCHF